MYCLFNHFDFSPILYRPVSKSYLVSTLLSFVVLSSAYSQESWELAATDKVVASDAAKNDQFGWSVSLSGNRAIVGAWADDDQGDRSGAAYILEWDSATASWVETAKLKASDGRRISGFGNSVSISGDRAIVGHYYAAEAAYIFERDATTGTWQEVAKLTASDATAGDNFGEMVAISGNYAIIGAVGSNSAAGDDSGAAYIFERDASTGAWQEVIKLTASDETYQGYFGRSVAISGNYAIVNGQLETSGTYIFERNTATGVWSEVSKLPGSVTVSINGDRAIIGRANFYRYDGGTYIFERDASTGTWQQVVRLTASAPACGSCFDKFGASVSIDGDYAIVGAPEDDVNGAQSGGVYLFEHDVSTGAWQEAAKLLAPDGVENDYFGHSVSISNDRALIGAWRNSSEARAAGAVYFANRETSSLPVELVSFEAKRHSDAVALQWTTATEQGNTGFEVHHRRVERENAPGGATWETVAFVEGAGTTQEVQTYHHRIAELDPGRHAFRLKQVDYDGQASFSSEVEVAIELPSAHAVSALHPNPFSSQASFTLAVRQTQTVRVDVFDLLGRRIATLYDDVLPAEHVERFHLDGSAWPSGTYLVRTSGDHFAETHRVMLVK